MLASPPKWPIPSAGKRALGIAKIMALRSMTKVEVIRRWLLMYRKPSMTDRKLGAAAPSTLGSVRMPKVASAARRKMNASNPKLTGRPNRAMRTPAMAGPAAPPRVAMV